MGPQKSIAGSQGCLADLGTSQLYYEEYGQGEPLVLLHGFGGSGKTWQPFIAPLAARFRLVVVDLPGHGGSSDVPGPFTHRGAGEAVMALVDQLGLDKFSAMGISSGGMTLLHMASAHPGRIRAQVLVSATTHFPPQARVIMGRVSLATMPPAVKKMYQGCATRGESQIRRLIQLFNALGQNYDDMNFTPEALSKITAPTLVVHGDRDQFFPVEIPLALFRALPRGALWIIPQADHVPIYRPGLDFAARALEFLESSPEN